ncbi:MAG: hypothetical protein V7K50_29250 [Nostoc sp.]|uniref:hypothetical protein n=1 Tax=Nostoc sp. TaxID=1180 RepID=UPI002FF51CF9
MSDRLTNLGNTEIRTTKRVLKVVENCLSANLSQTDRQVVMQAISTIREKLPFLIDLTTEERRSLSKLGDKSLNTVGIRFFDDTPLIAKTRSRASLALTKPY